MKRLNPKSQKEKPDNLNLEKLRKELAKYHYENVLDDVILLMRETAKKSGKNATVKEIEKFIINFWTEWDTYGTPMAVEVVGRLKSNEGGKTIKVYGCRNQGKSMQLKNTPSWLFLLCSLYEEHRVNDILPKKSLNTKSFLNKKSLKVLK